MSARWSPFIKQIAVVTILIAVIWLLARARLLLPPLILALLLAYLLSFPVGWTVRNTGSPRTPVVVVTYVVVILISIIAPVVIVPRLVTLFGALGGTLLNIAQELAAATPRPIVITPSLKLDPGIYYAPVSAWLRSVMLLDVTSFDRMQAFLFPFASGAAVVVRSAVTSVLWTVFILVTSFYIVKDGPIMGRWLSARLPDAMRPEAQRLWQEVGSTWDAFVRGQFTLALMVGLIVWIGTTILGVRNAPALGLLSGFAEFIPGIGPTTVGVVGTIIALIFGSTWLTPPLSHQGFAAIVGLFYITVQQYENVYLVPRIVGRRIALHPVVVIVGAVAGAEMFGVLGILLAAPTVASLRILLSYIIHKLLDEDPFPPAQPLPDRTVVWPALLVERSVCAILFDLDGTLVETDDSAIERLAQALNPVRRLFPDANLVHIARRIFLISNLLLNHILTVISLLHLNRLLTRFNDRLRLARGIRPPDAFIAVPGSTEMLRWLARRYRLGIVTSRPREETIHFLNQYGLAPLFRSVVTRDDVRQLEPHPAQMRLATRQLGAPPEQCVMVGDTGLDVQAAKAVGMLTIGVLSGFGEDRDLCDADLIISSTAQLGAWL